MAACDDSRPDAFSDPRLHDEVSDARLDAHELTGLHAESIRILRMHPQRIRMRDLIEPLRVRAARVNLDRQTKGRDQRHLARFEILGMDVTADVAGNGQLRPTPLRE